MNPILVSAITFTCVFGGALVGLALKAVIPAKQRDQDSRDVVKLGMGLIATMTALVLGLVTASAKSAFDKEEEAYTKCAANVLLLDRVLAHFGPETQDIRQRLKRDLEQSLASTFGGTNAGLAALDAPAATGEIEAVEVKVRELAPKNDGQKWLQSRAQDLCHEVLQARLLAFAGVQNAIPTPLVVVVVFWLTILFSSFGLFAPRNPTVVSVLIVSALSVSAAIFLILDMKNPFQGLMRVSDAPLRFALAHLGA